MVHRNNTVQTCPNHSRSCSDTQPNTCGLDTPRTLYGAYIAHAAETQSNRLRSAVRSRRKACRTPSHASQHAQTRQAKPHPLACSTSREWCPTGAGQPSGMQPGTPCSSQGWERAAASTPPCCAATRSSRFQMHSRPRPKCLRSEERTIAAPELRESSAACSGASTLRTSTLNSGRPLRPSPRPHWPASQARSEQRAGGSLTMARPRPRTHLRTRPFALEGGWVGK